MGARDVIGHEVDKRTQPGSVQSVEQGAKFGEALRRTHGVIGAKVEAILDRIRRTRAAFDQRGIIRGLADGRVVGASGLLQHAGQPNVGEAHLRE